MFQRYLPDRKTQATPIALGALAIGALAVLAAREKPNRVDIALTVRLQRQQSPFFAHAMKMISSPGYAPFTHSIVLSMATHLWAMGRRRDAIFSVGTMGAGFTTGVLKMLIRRPRPDLQYRQHHRLLKDNSFPSGHATHYSVFYGYVFYLVSRYLPNAPLRWALLSYCAGLMISVGPSRVYLGHHWTSDVLAGQLVGFTYLLILLRTYQLFEFSEVFPEGTMPSTRATAQQSLAAEHASRCSV